MSFFNGYKSFLGLAALAALGLTLTAPAALAQDDGAPTISDARQECIARVPYPMVNAEIAPLEAPAKVYFRAAQGADFYAVAMQPAGDRQQAILPVPAGETQQVVYYVEALNASGESARSDEFTAEVVDDEGECDEEVFAGTEPGIVVFAAAEGASALPAGFLATGIASTVTVAGVTTAVGGEAVGLGVGAIAGIVAGGAAAGAVIIDELDEDDESTITP